MAVVKVLFMILTGETEAAVVFWNRNEKKGRGIVRVVGLQGWCAIWNDGFEGKRGSEMEMGGGDGRGGRG